MAALALLGDANRQASRHCIDLSGDGKESIIPHSRSRFAAAILARTTAENQQVTINALAIESEEKDLARWYRRNIVTNDGFVIAVDRIEAFGDAIVRKLIREIRRFVVAGSPSIRSSHLTLTTQR
jgi:Ca-activated chloride channel family protein